MVIKQFYKKYRKQFKTGHPIITKFFIVFARFESALKTAGFISTRNNKVQANWDNFVSSIRCSFIYEENEKLSDAVNYILQHPPKKQTVDINNRLVWEDRVFEENAPIINRLSLSIRDIRNNLFHGGKFSGNYQPDISRNRKLLENSLAILNEWLLLDENVKEKFLAPIE